MSRTAQRTAFRRVPEPPAFTPIWRQPYACC